MRLEEGARPGDLEVVDLRGRPRSLGEFRRRTHVVLLWIPTAGPSDRAAWGERRKAEADRWSWIGAEPVVPASSLPESAPGIYLISRWGTVIGIHPPGPWDMDRIEHDLLTFEAQDSCG